MTATLCKVEFWGIWGASGLAHHGAVVSGMPWALQITFLGFFEFRGRVSGYFEGAPSCRRKKARILLKIYRIFTFVEIWCRAKQEGRLQNSVEIVEFKSAASADRPLDR